MSRVLAGSLSLLALWGFCCGAVVAADDAEAVQAADGGAPLVTVEDNAAAAQPPVRARHRMAPLDGPWYANHELPLRTDGNLPGKLQRFDDAGNLVPVRGRLFFIQHNHIVMRTMSEDGGTFQVTGLDPGVYSVVVASPEGFGAFAIRILAPLEREAPANNNNVKEAPPVRSTSFRDWNNSDYEYFDEANLTMTVPLIPPSDYQVVSQVVQQETNNFGSPVGAPPFFGGNFSGAASGAGGGAGGLGALLGAGGLAGGITAIATSGSGGTTVSTSTTTP